MLSRSHDWSALCFHLSNGCIEFWIFNIRDGSQIYLEKWGRRVLIHMQRQWSVTFRCSHFPLSKFNQGLSVLWGLDEVTEEVCCRSSEISALTCISCCTMILAPWRHNVSELESLWSPLHDFQNLCFVLRIACVWRQIFGSLSSKFNVEKIQADLSQRSQQESEGWRRYFFYWTSPHTLSSALKPLKSVRINSAAPLNSKARHGSTVWRSKAAALQGWRALSTLFVHPAVIC